MNSYMGKNSITNFIRLIKKMIYTKQDIVYGNPGQVISFDDNRKMIPVNPSSMDGAVVPVSEIQRLESLIEENKKLIDEMNKKNDTTETSLRSLISNEEIRLSNFMDISNKAFKSLGELSKEQVTDIIGYLGINNIWTPVGYMVKYNDNTAMKTFHVIGLDCSDTAGNKTVTGIQLGFTSHGELLKRRCNSSIWEEWTSLN